MIRLEHLEFSERLQTIFATLVEIIDEFQPQIAAAECSVNCTAEPLVEGHWDEFRIEQVVSNLLTNALRYGSKSPIEVRVYQTPEHACIEVQDHGIGISEENQQRIFQQFERVSSKAATAGLGLGLFIAREVALGHKGTLEVESDREHGTVFTMRLPMGAPGG